MFSHSCATISTINLKNFYHSKEKPKLISSHSSFPSPSLSFQICPFWTFHVNGVIQYVIFCDCLPSGCIMFLKFTHVIMYKCFTPFHGRIVFHCLDVPHFVCPVISCWTLHCFCFWLLGMMLL